MNEKDLQLVASLFKELTRGKFKLAVVSSENESEYLFDLSDKPCDTFDDLISQTLVKTINKINEHREKRPPPTPPLLNPPPPEVMVESKENPLFNTPYANPVMWEDFLKKPQ